MLDTVRADMLSTYGGKIAMPGLDRLARHGTRYNIAISPGTYTLPSHLSIFLGKRVSRIRGLKNTGMKFSDLMTDPFLKKARYTNGEVTLAKMMEYFGYKSALFSNNPFVSEPTGLADGFSYSSNVFVDRILKENKLSVRAILHLVENDAARKNLVRLAYLISSTLPSGSVDSLYLELRKKLNRHFSNEYGYYELDKGALETNRMVREYAAHWAGQRNFVFINYMEGHEGYPTNLVTRRYVEQDKWLHMIGETGEDGISIMKDAYGKRLEYLDRKVSDMLESLRKEGMLDDAMVIVTSDHGQAFMEHEQMFHNIHPYNEVCRVPLVAAHFKDGRQVRSPQVIEEPFSLTNLNKLILGSNLATSGPVVSEHTGITEVWDTYLLRLFKKRSVNADRIYRKKVELDRPVTAVFRGRYKLVHHHGRTRDELYDIAADADEEHNIIASNRSMAHMLLRQSTNVG